MSIEIIKEIQNVGSISIEKSFCIAQKCTEMLRVEETKADAQKIIIYILENWEKLESGACEIWVDIVESIGFYPYLEKYKNILQLNNTASIIRKGYFKSRNLKEIYFHEEQKELLRKLEKGINIIVSAPTSFGKSLLIEEIVSSKLYKNIVVIQPTLALLDETRKKLSKYKNEYKIIIKTTQSSALDKGNIFLLTAERVLEYKELPRIDFLVLDEFYKLSAKRDDERSDILNNAFYLLLNNHKCKFMLLGPNIEEISQGFTKKYNAEFFQTKYSLVANEEVDFYSEFRGQFGQRGQKRLFKEEKLFELLLKLKGEQTIIFCSSPSRVRSLSNKFSDYLKEHGFNQISPVPLVEWIEKNINRHWGLITTLKYKIGIHDGALPKHITSSIIKYFNDNILSYLFCTTTIIEGVNTNAKNIIYFDDTKGIRKKIDYFDYSNIKGRAGRMMVHLVGRIYNFNPPPKKEQIIIDIPFFEQNPIADEVLIHLDYDEIKYPESEQSTHILNLPTDIKKIIKHNGISVKGQENILKEMTENFNYNLLCWTGYPEYKQLEYVLSLAWDNLLKKGESTNPMTKKKLVKQTFDYGNNKSIRTIISNNFNYYKDLDRYINMSKYQVLDDSIRDAFQILRHWFQYKVPKWLSVMNSLQEYVCTQKGVPCGNYLFYAGMIENDFLPDNLLLLSEYNIPTSAIKKIKNKIPNSLDEDKLLEYNQSSKYNPFKSASETVCKDMLINMSEWSEEHYKSNAERYIQRLIKLLNLKKIPLSFKNIIDKIPADKFEKLSADLVKAELLTKEQHLTNLELIKSSGKITENASARFSTIAESELGEIFDENGIDIFRALNENAVILFVLNPLIYPETSQAMGRLVLIDSKKAISKMFNKTESKRKFFIFDEINVYASPVLIDLVNKSRSADVTCILATQSLADLESVAGEPFKQQIIENCNNYVVLRQNSFSSAEEWAKTLGTKEIMRMTYQISKSNATEMGTAKKVREFIVHPDEIKGQQTGTGVFLSRDTGKCERIKIHKPF